MFLQCTMQRISAVSWKHALKIWIGCWKHETSTPRSGFTQKWMTEKEFNVYILSEPVIQSIAHEAFCSPRTTLLSLHDIGLTMKLRLSVITSGKDVLTRIEKFFAGMASFLKWLVIKMCAHKCDENCVFLIFAGSRLRECLHKSQVHSKGTGDSCLSRQLRLPTESQFHLQGMAQATACQVGSPDFLPPLGGGPFPAESFCPLGACCES